MHFALPLAVFLAASAAQSGPPAPDAPTRAERWQALRRAKAQRLEPYRPTFVERQILAFEKAERPSILDWNFHGLYPRIQGIAKGSRNALGARLWRPNLGATELDLHASAFYSVNGYEFYDVQFGRIPGAAFRLEAVSPLPLRSTKGDDLAELATIARPDGRGWSLYGSARYQHYTRLPYFGQGPDSSRDDEVTYLSRDSLFSLEGGYQLSRHLVATLSLGYLQWALGPGEDPESPSIEEVFDDATAPGLAEPADFLVARLNVVLDWRDVIGYPKRGVVLAFEATRYADRGDGAYSFDRFGIDARGYVPLGSEQRTLALRSYASWDRTADGARVPFYLQRPLGGSHTLRGFRNFRFQGESLVLLQGEYRWEPNPTLELALFVDSGTVGTAAETLDLDRLRTSWGTGLRFKTAGNVLLRLEWATGDEDTRWYLRFSQAW